MPRLQVYLPDDLYKQLKKRGLPASELLQQAVRAEIRRQGLEEAADRYMAELEKEVGKPTAAHRARAAAIVRGTPPSRARRAG